MTTYVAFAITVSLRSVLLFVLFNCSRIMVAQERLTPEEMVLSRTTDHFLRQVFDSLNSKNEIADEIELTDKQKSSLQAIANDHSKSIKKIEFEIQREEKAANDSNLAGVFGDRKSMLVFQVCRNSVGLIEKELQPQQLERLRQIAIQYEFSIGSGFGFQLIPALARQIDLSNREVADVREAISTAQQEFNTEMRALRERLDRRVLESLSKDGRARIHELIGEFFYSD